MNKRKGNILYWTCQLIGWGIYFIFLLGSMFLFTEPIPILVKLQLIIGFTLFCISHGLRTYFKNQQWTEKPVRWVFPRLLLVLVLASILSQVFIHLMMIFLINWEDYRPIEINEFFIYAANVFIVFFLWSVLYFSYHYWQNNRRRELENWQLQARLNEAELTILKSQINPHFLFNSLNNIRSLILSEPEKARDMITHISDLMRYFIQFNSKEKVTVEQEVEVVQDYLALEKIQFDERLIYEINAEKEVMSHKIPPMSVQLLVENAIKHGISQLAEGGSITVNIGKELEEITIDVINSGQLSEKDSDSGIGLQNLRDRMKLLFGTDSDIRLENNDRDSVMASIKIPV